MDDTMTSSTVSDHRQLVTPDDDRASLESRLISHLGPRYRPLLVTPYIIVHMLLLGLLFLLVVLLPFPFFCKYVNCHLHTYTIQTLMHIMTWLASAVLHAVLHRLHYDSYIHGYTEFYHSTWMYRKLPAAIYTIGNALLLLLSVTFRELDSTSTDPTPSPVPVQWPLSAFHYVQLLTGLEMVLLMPVFIRYLRDVMKFNAARMPPDVAHEDLDMLARDAAARRTRVSSSARHLRTLLRQQADAMQALKSHNQLLARKVVQLHTRLISHPTLSYEALHLES